MEGFSLFLVNKINKIMEFIKATDNDIPMIQNLARRSWESAYAEILSVEQMEYMLNTMYSKDEIREQLLNPNYHYYLLQGEMSFFDGFIGYENQYKEKTTKLHRIYLIPESKGKGLGKMALEFLKEKVSEVGDERIILNVNKNNSARRFYESYGFRIYDEGIFDIGNNYVMDDYLMEFLFINRKQLKFCNK